MGRDEPIGASTECLLGSHDEKVGAAGLAVSFGSTLAFSPEPPRGSDPS